MSTKAFRPITLDAGDLALTLSAPCATGTPGAARINPRHLRALHAAAATLPEAVAVAADGAGLCDGGAGGGGAGVAAILTRAMGGRAAGASTSGGASTVAGAVASSGRCGARARLIASLMIPVAMLTALFAGVLVAIAAVVLVPLPMLLATAMEVAAAAVVVVAAAVLPVVALMMNRAALAVFRALDAVLLVAVDVTVAPTATLFPEIGSRDVRLQAAADIRHALEDNDVPALVVSREHERCLLVH